MAGIAAGVRHRPGLPHDDFRRHPSRGSELARRVRHPECGEHRHGDFCRRHEQHRRHRRRHRIKFTGSFPASRANRPRRIWSRGPSPASTSASGAPPVPDFRHLDARFGPARLCQRRRPGRLDRQRPAGRRRHHHRLDFADSLYGYGGADTITGGGGGVRQSHRTATAGETYTERRQRHLMVTSAMTRPVGGDTQQHRVPDISRTAEFRPRPSSPAFPATIATGGYECAHATPPPKNRCDLTGSIPSRAPRFSTSAIAAIRCTPSWQAGRLYSVRTISESGWVGVRRCDSACRATRFRQTGVRRLDDRRRCHSISLGDGRLQARRARAAHVRGGGGSDCGLGRTWQLWRESRGSPARRLVAARMISTRSRLQRGGFGAPVAGARR